MYKSDRQTLINKECHIVSSSDDIRFIKRVTIVNLILNGVKASALAHLVGKQSIICPPGARR